MGDTKVKKYISKCRDTQFLLRKEEWSRKQGRNLQKKKILRKTLELQTFW